MGLFDRAKKLMQGGPAMAASRAQSYRVACPEGHMLHGHRTEGYQALRCPECNAGIFVLPRSPLPEPVAPKSGAPIRRRPAPMVGDDLVLAEPPSPAEIARARADHDASRGRPAVEPETTDVEPEAEIEWVDEGDADDSPPSPAPVKAPTKPRKAGPARPDAARAERPRAPEPVPAGMIAVEEAGGFAEWAGRNKNTLIFAAVMVVVGVTVAWRVRQRRIEDLPRVVEAGRVDGLSRLDGGDFPGAKQLLAQAASAVIALGGEIEGAEEVTRGAREAALFADLTDVPLRDLVEEAAKSNPPDAWPAHFDAIYKGRSILLEAAITEVPDPDKPGSSYAIDWPIYYGNAASPAGKGRVDLAGFALLDQARPKVGDVVTFGARLAAVRFDDAKSEWAVSLVPDSGAFITHARALAHLPGWDADARDAEAKEVGP